MQAMKSITRRGWYYRYDGKGDLVKGEMDTYDTGRTYENGYAGRAEQDTADQPRG